MDAEVQREFERRDKLNMWLGGLALTVSLTFGTCAIERAFTAQAQVQDTVSKNGEQDRMIERNTGLLGKAQETREKVIEIDARLRNIENDVGELKTGQQRQQAILEEIRREVKR